VAGCVLSIWGSVPNVVEKGIGMSYPIGKPTNRKGGHADEERIPQGTGIDHVRAGIIADGLHLSYNRTASLSSRTVTGTRISVCTLSKPAQYYFL
jgi:hypothetical protein